MAIMWLGERGDVDRELVGAKARSLNRMLALGLPVPPGFVLGTDTYARFRNGGDRLPGDVIDEMAAAVPELEHRSGRRFGDPRRPLLVSVRSGAAHSMPGMMDTFLNLGVTAAFAHGPGALTAESKFAADVRQRLAEQFAGLLGTAPPEDPVEQLVAAVDAVFRSSNSPRAQSYRRYRGIPADGSTAVTVQAMVFGNLDEHSGTGVIVSRNPLTGASDPFGEWLPRGQGEDLVSGRWTPERLDALARQLPRVHDQLTQTAKILESAGKDVQEIEFTVESGRLWLLQTRAAKRSPDAAVRIAVALHEDGIVTVPEAIRLVTPEQLSALQRVGIAPAVRAGARLLARGEPACPGIASGTVVLEAEGVEGPIDAVLVRPTTNPQDVAGMIAAAAILTEVGGSTSHAAVVSRELGTPCVVGCGVDVLQPLSGRQVTVDGSTGEVFDGALDTIDANTTANPALAVFNSWLAAKRAGADPAPTAGLSGVAVDDLCVLQAIRLKGSISPDELAGTLDAETAIVDSIVRRLVAGELVAGGAALRITPSGRQRLAELLADERSGHDGSVVAGLHDEFRLVNADFKALIARWQVRDGKPNAHDDPGYDARVLAGIDGIHDRAMNLIGVAAQQFPRLSRYAAKLTAALAKVRAGDVSWLTRPLVDSYHTVWFELHEELILAAGSTRDAEARAGHAQ